MKPTRNDTLPLFLEHNKSASLYHHAIAVEAVMRYFAEEYDEDVEKWGLIGLIHDLDWEKWPELHCQKTQELLEEADWPEDWIRSVMSHAWGMKTDIEPVHMMEKVLYAIDELTGLITATAMMRPSKSLMDLGVASVMKKWKMKGFSAGVDRAVIDRGAAMLGLERRVLIEKTIAGMRKVSTELELS